jgi:hypothetical protein
VGREYEKSPLKLHSNRALDRRQGWGTALAVSTYHLPEAIMFTFLVWLVLLFFCWPLALLALVLYPIIWLLLLPFRLVGIAVGGVLALVKAIIMLPARLLKGPRRAY